MDARTAERTPTGARVGPGAEIGVGPGRFDRVLETAAEHPLLVWWGLSLLLAVLSAIVWPTVPSYDPFSWVVWGREVTDPHISFYIGSGPSWKPLPFAFTTVYGIFGGIAPTLWVITARTGGIAGLIAAVRLGDLLCRRAGLPRWAGILAGLVALIGIVLSNPTSLWTYYFFRGTSETLLIGVWLWAIDRLIARHHWQAFMLIAAEGLMRPEAWPFLLVYGAWLFWKLPSMRVWVVLGWIAQPIGWFVPPWISTGQPFLAASHASEYNGHLGADVLKTVLTRGESLQPLPSLVFGVIAVLVALWVGRERLPRHVRQVSAWFSDEVSEVPLVLGLAVATIAWWVIVVAMTEDGYPGLQRFYLPAAAMTCVLSGYGLVRLAALAGELVAGLSGRARAGAAGAAEPVDAADAADARGRILVPVAVVVAIVLLGGSTHYLTARWASAKQQEPLAAAAVTRIDQLGTAIKDVGGEHALFPCTSSVVTVNHSLQTALAWKLGTTLGRVQTVLSRPGVAFVGPHDSIDGGVPPIGFSFKAILIRKVGAWQIFRVYRSGQPRASCVGS